MAAQRDTGMQPGGENTAKPRQKPDLREALSDMQERLRRHSALEDLGPLFGPEAQGRRPPQAERG
jgi:hypothetical protein